MIHNRDETPRQGFSRFTFVMHLVPVLLLTFSWIMAYWGIAASWPLRSGPDGPVVPLVSVSQGMTKDVWSSLPGLLQVGFAIFQSLLVVELARLFWVVNKSMTAWRFALTLAYELCLVVDWVRVWAGDWFIWATYRLNLSELCVPANPCYPISGAKPWASLLLLIAALSTVLFKPAKRH